MAEVTLNIEPVSEVEEVQESEHEIQETETEAWRSALSDVTSELAALSQRVLAALETQGTQSTELRTLVETQAQLIRDLMTAKAEADRQLLETVRNLLTPPVPVVVETPNPTPPEMVEPAIVESGEEVRVKRFRGI